MPQWECKVEVTAIVKKTVTVEADNSSDAEEKCDNQVCGEVEDLLSKANFEIENVEISDGEEPVNLDGEDEEDSDEEEEETETDPEAEGA